MNIENERPTTRGGGGKSVSGNSTNSRLLIYIGVGVVVGVAILVALFS